MSWSFSSFSSTLNGMARLFARGVGQTVVDVRVAIGYDRENVVFRVG